MHFLNTCLEKVSRQEPIEKYKVATQRPRYKLISKCFSCMEKTYSLSSNLTNIEEMTGKC